MTHFIDTNWCLIWVELGYNHPTTVYYFDDLLITLYDHLVVFSWAFLTI